MWFPRTLANLVSLSVAYDTCVHIYILQFDVWNWNKTHCWGASVWMVSCLKIERNLAMFIQNMITLW